MDQTESSSALPCGDVDDLIFSDCEYHVSER